MIASGVAGRVLLATADTYSKYIHPKDRSARVLFGDGAAVSIVEATNTTAGFSSCDLASHGQQSEKFYIPAGGPRPPKPAQSAGETTHRDGHLRTPGHVRMDSVCRRP